MNAHLLFSVRTLYTDCTVTHFHETSLSHSATQSLPQSQSLHRRRRCCSSLVVVIVVVVVVVVVVVFIVVVVVVVVVFIVVVVVVVVFIFVVVIVFGIVAPRRRLWLSLFAPFLLLESTYALFRRHRVAHHVAYGSSKKGRHCLRCWRYCHWRKLGQSSAENVCPSGQGWISRSRWLSQFKRTLPRALGSRSTTIGWTVHFVLSTFSDYRVQARYVFTRRIHPRCLALFLLLVDEETERTKHEIFAASGSVIPNNSNEPTCRLVTPCRSTCRVGSRKS